MCEPFRCPERLRVPGSPLLPEFDEWKTLPNGDRVCSFCGSLHPDDFASILEGYVSGRPGFSFDTTTKSYKRYASKPDVSNASEGGIKFYLWHLPGPGPELDVLKELHARAIDRWVSDMGKLTGAKP